MEPKYSPITKAILRLNAEGVTKTKEIARQVGCCQGNVYLILKREKCRETTSQLAQSLAADIRISGDFEKPWPVECLVLYLKLRGNAASAIRSLRPDSGRHSYSLQELLNASLPTPSAVRRQSLGIPLYSSSGCGVHTYVQILTAMQTADLGEKWQREVSIRFAEWLPYFKSTPKLAAWVRGDLRR